MSDQDQTYALYGKNKSGKPVFADRDTGEMESPDNDGFFRLYAAYEMESVERVKQELRRHWQPMRVAIGTKSPYGFLRSRLVLHQDGKSWVRVFNVDDLKAIMKTRRQRATEIYRHLRQTGWKTVPGAKTGLEEFIHNVIGTESDEGLLFQMHHGSIREFVSEIAEAAEASAGDRK